MAQTAEAKVVKTFNNLFPAICSLDNLYLAARKARRLKSRKIYVEDFELHRERSLGLLHNRLLEGGWRPSGYRQFTIHDPKKRLISAAPYSDRVVHHALCNVIEPLVERRFISDSFSCQTGKGTTAARERCRVFTNRYAYVLKCDVEKFFQSIDHEVLMSKLGGIIRCRATLNLCRLIVESYRDKELLPRYFRGDDLFSPGTRLHGLPIGNLTSQLWANLYLDRMDHFVKEILRVAGYCRYTDDWLIWSDDKAFLRHCLIAIEETLQTERLALNKTKTRIMAVREGVPFLGFRFFPGRAPRVLGATKRRFEKRSRRQAKMMRGGLLDSQAVRKSMVGWVQFSRYGYVEGLMKRYRMENFGRAGYDGCAGFAGRVLEQQQSGESALFVPQQQRSVES